MNILMYRGHGKGSNIQQWLDWFQFYQSCHHLTYLTFSFSFDRTQYNKINIKLFTKSIRGYLKIIQFLLKEKFDVIYIQGLYEFKLHLLLLIFGRAKLRILNIWNNVNYKKAVKGRERYLYRYILHRIDRINFNWYNTYYNFTNTFPTLKHKCAVHFWGLHGKFFEDAAQPSNFTKAFLAGISDHKTVAFCPKSINKYNRFDTVISALNKLKQSDRTLLKNFYFYIWTGNFVDSRILSELKAEIEYLGLQNNVFIVEHPRISFSDMVHIWNRVDFSINIVDADQLSTSVLEPIYLKKDIILSDIDSYRYLNRRFALNIRLTPNNPDDIASAIKTTLTKKTDKTELSRRSKVIEEHFNFNENISKIIRSFEHRISLRPDFKEMSMTLNKKPLKMTSKLLQKHKSE